MVQRIFLAGGFGQTTKALSKRLIKHKDVKLVLSSRTGKVAADFDHDVVRFDWLDPSTFEAPYKDGPVDSVYIMNHNRFEIFKEVKPFIDYAIEHGTKRFVLLARVNAYLSDTNGAGLVWQYFIDKKVDYTVLRPHWFMDNIFLPRYVRGIKEDSAIYNIDGTSATPFVSVDDIALVAEQAFLLEKSPNDGIVITGSENVNYIQLAEIFTRVLGKKIEYKHKDEKEFGEWLKSIDIDPSIFLLVEGIKQKSDFQPDPADFEKYTGRKPTRIEDFITQHKDVFV